MMYVRVAIPPTEEVITLARARLQCKIDADIPPVAPATEPTSERDPEITDAIASARQTVQEYLQRAIGEQTFELVLTGWQRCVSIPFGAVTSIESIKYQAPGGEQIMPSASYSVSGGDKPVLKIEDAPELADEPDNVRIRYVSGYTETTLPAPIKSAMLLLIKDLVENTSRQVDRPLSENAAFCNLLATYRLGMGV